jgi:23S rRNA (adenine1618-N6)-methyltransferase
MLPKPYLRARRVDFSSLSSIGGKQKQSRGKPHPRNSFTGTYDMDRLIAAYPSLEPFVKRTRMGEPCRPTITYSDSDACRALNTALLVADYGVHPKYSEILPLDALLPPVPGRADYVHNIADLLALSSPTNRIPTGPNIIGMDIGTGASAIYPTLATSLYKWKMIASEINTSSIGSAKQIIEANGHTELINVRQQASAKKIFDGVLRTTEKIDFAMCNPPFYPSLEAFQKENARKLKGLAKGGLNKILPIDDIKQRNDVQGEITSNNFGGSGSELWCEGGEVAFVKRIIKESKTYSDRCLWFSSLVSRKMNFKRIEGSLFVMGKSASGNKQGRPVHEVKKIEFGTGHKSSTILFWTYFDKDQRIDWARMRGWD